MEEKILEAKEEFKKVIDFVTRDALSWERHSVEGEVFRMLLGLRRILLELFLRSVGTGHGGRGVYPLEAQLNLPKRLYSYLLQKWMTRWGVRTTYEGAVETVEDFLGLDLAHRPIQRVARDLTPVVTEFDNSLEAPQASSQKNPRFSYARQVNAHEQGSAGRYEQDSPPIRTQGRARRWREAGWEVSW
jgi:hypothetical protein